MLCGVVIMLKRSWVSHSDLLKSLTCPWDRLCSCMRAQDPPGSKTRGRSGLWRDQTQWRVLLCLSLFLTLSYSVVSVCVCCVINKGKKLNKSILPISTKYLTLSNIPGDISFKVVVPRLFVLKIPFHYYKIIGGELLWQSSDVVLYKAAGHEVNHEFKSLGWPEMHWASRLEKPEDPRKSAFSLFFSCVCMH